MTKSTINKGLLHTRQGVLVWGNCTRMIQYILVQSVQYVKMPMNKGFSPYWYTFAQCIGKWKSENRKGNMSSNTDVMTVLRKKSPALKEGINE